MPTTTETGPIRSRSRRRCDNPRIRRDSHTTWTRARGLHSVVRNSSRSATTGPRYAWLGTAQRDATAANGLTVMGVRLYNPVSGQFLSTDQVYGGNATTYGYPADPINQFDTSGLYMTARDRALENGWQKIRRSITGTFMSWLSDKDDEDFSRGLIIFRMILIAAGANFWSQCAGITAYCSLRNTGFVVQLQVGLVRGYAAMAADAVELYFSVIRKPTVANVLKSLYGKRGSSVMAAMLNLDQAGL